MEKIEASKLLTIILSEPVKSRSVVILSDELVFQKCVEDILTQTTQKRPRIFTGSTPLTDYTQYVRQNDLFEPVQNAIIILDEKFSEKKLSGQKMPNAENIVFVFGKTSLKQAIPKEIFQDSSIYLCYSPKEQERLTCAKILMQYYWQGTHNTNCQQDMAVRALITYNNNLYHCALHFERMQKGHLSFQDALLPDAPVSNFDIVNTLLEGDLTLIDIKLRQYFDNGEDASSILHALVYFFKQVVFVQNELANQNTLFTAFKNAKTPYPAQDSIKKAIHLVSYKKIEHFLSICASLELEFRECKNPHQILFLELRHLLDSK